MLRCNPELSADRFHAAEALLEGSEAGGPGPRRLTRGCPAEAGHCWAIKRLSLLVDGALGDLGEGFISSLLLLQCLLQKRHGVFKTKLFRPSDERPVAGDFVMLDGLGGG